MKVRRKKPVAWMIAAPVLWPFVLLYATGVRLKNIAFDTKLRKPGRLSQPVISVGNLSLGGSGKTPVVLLLAELLKSRGWIVDVLSRGYGRVSQSVEHVDPHGVVERFGDEPLLIARRGISVYVGADRYQAGQLAEQEQWKSITPDNTRIVHLLDDGFQHRRLVRDVNIVVLQRDDLKDEMLPVGRLREPLCALERADICILRAQDADLTERVLRLMRKNDSSRVWIINRQTTIPNPQKGPLGNAIAFCAIGDPDGFFQGLKQVGITLIDSVVFRDHHIFTHSDIEHLKGIARKHEASCFITTEKDNVRLTGAMRSELEMEMPLVIAELTVHLREEAHSMAVLESLLAPHLQISPGDVR